MKKTKKNYLVIIFVIFLMIFTGLFADQDEIKYLKEIQLNTKIPTMRITNIIQDQTGYIWFSTNRGIYKYDGNSYKYYKTDINSQSPIFENIIALHIDKNNNVWLAIKNKLKKFDIINDKFIDIYTLDSSFKIWNINSNKKNELLLTSIKKGIYKYSPLTKSLSPLILNEDQNDPKTKKKKLTYWFVYNNKGDEYWIGTNKGLLYYDGIDSVMYCKNQICFNYHLDTPEIMWIGSKNLITKFNINTKEKNNYLFGKQFGKSVSQILKKNSSELLISGYSNTLFEFNKLTKTFNKYETKNFTPNNIVCMCLDRTKTLWIGTRRRLFKSYFTPKITHYLKNDNKQKSLSDNGILAMCENDTGNIICGTIENNINIINIKNDIIKQFSISRDFNFPKMKFHLDKSNKYITSIYDEGNGNLLLGTTLGLLKANFQNYSIKQIELDPSQKSGNQRINDIYEDSDGNIWVISPNGLFKYDKENGIIDHNFKGKHIYCIHEDVSNDLLLGTMENILVYNYLNDTLSKTIYPSRKRNRPIRHIYSDNQDNIFYGFNKYGVEIFNKRKNSFSQFSEMDGLPSNNILNIKRGNNSNIWISTDFGLSRFDPKTKKLTNFSNTRYSKNLIYFLKNNLYETFPIYDKQSIYRETNYSPLFFSDDGCLNVAGMNGINRFNPNDLPQKTENFKMIMSGIKLYNKPILYHKYLNNKNNEYTFSYKDDIITFDFAIISYLEPEANKYAFYLDGYNEDFFYNDHQEHKNSITYSNLPPGRYILKTKGTDYQGFWIDGPSYKIRITPPFWKTYWFYLIFITFIIFCIIIVIKLNTKKIVDQKNVLEIQVNQRTIELSQKEKDLQEINTQLEQRVAHRTQKLQETNIQLNEEVEKSEKLNLALKNSKDEIVQNLGQQILLSDISMKFNSLSDFNIKTNEVLSMLGNHTNVSRVYIFEIDETKKHASNTFEWCVPTISSEINNLQNLPFEIVTDWYSILKTNNMICANDIAEFDNTTYKFLDQQSIKSILVFPLYISENFSGIIGFDECIKKREWSDSEINLLNTVSNIFSNAFEKRETENSLIESERTARAILNSSDDAAALLDINSTILSLNESFRKLINKPFNKLVGTYIGDHYSDNVVKTREPIFKQCVKSKSPISYEAKSVSSEKYFINNMYPILDINNNVNSVAIFLRDITDQKEAEQILTAHKEKLEDEVAIRTIELNRINKQLTEEIKIRILAEKDLKKSEKEKRENLERFTLQLAHEIKNPLASIKSSAQLVESNQDLKPDKTNTIKHTRIINRNVDICNKVIQDLYTYTHQTGFEVDQKKVSTVHNNLVNYAKETSINKPGIVIKNSINTDGTKFNIDEFRLMQALKNLLNNSVDAIDEAGEIKIDTTTDNNKYILFKISDTGCGISNENISEIFSPFFSTKPTGFGIGLSVVDEIIKRHSGKIDIQSKEGVGTEISVFLPINNEKI